MEQVDEKQRRFYENLFTQTEEKQVAKPGRKPSKDKKQTEQGEKAQKKATPKQGKKAKQGFKAKMEAMQRQKTSEEELREK